ncbi:DUF3365 domain-containing protein [Leptospira levettii]|uniref:DUF3365 domain-containing protein n=1 Tax=Leptospira levettii TaxID=2023178 RepID=A0AAW5VDX0_9LEPT|nr:DUF3365 domain-containing protein [Leptospira levettii]MCW7467737.1 DUF3365 domain-containing protein [Leptospira levettii]MCW7495898.1 DUF3365 domain-containing protein [Leptospira levettii]MCW7513244.1 DUF3365 domain-containing protein [Leptospira levettii]MCW7516984.1 DUF3365 domain-containing protein [Leptospira levettii]TGM32931.1 DUF3365 domain-containing protein [Leptospira levettii]
MNQIELKVLVFLFFSIPFYYCQKETINYKSLAIQITNEAKSNLQKKLSTAMSDGGTTSAIPFCNQNALDFTSKMGQTNNVTLKRVTDKPRNGNNLLSLEEMLVFKEIQKQKSGEGVFPNRVISSDRNVTVYIPIPMMGQCVQCHGKPEEMSVETKSILKKLYPSDKAVGYQIGDLRGLFVVIFKK